MSVCSKCGNDFKALHLHEPHCKEGTVAVAEKPEPQARSQRGREARGMDTRYLSPLEQIRSRPQRLTPAGGGPTGPWAYYIRPEGATIRDALILYPNGAKLPPSEDKRGAFSANAEYYQNRQAQKGYEYVGPVLTDRGIDRLLEVMDSNKDDEILFLEDEIAACQHDIDTADDPRWRDNQRRRKRQFQKRLDYVREGFDPSALKAELAEIARAQRMAKVSPETLTVMREMIGEVNVKFEAMVNKFRSAPGEDADSTEMNTGKGVIE